MLLPAGYVIPGRSVRMKPYKYQALVTLYPPEDDGLDAEPPCTSGA